MNQKNEYKKLFESLKENPGASEELLKTAWVSSTNPKDKRKVRVIATFFEKHKKLSPKQAWDIYYIVRMSDKKIKDIENVEIPLIRKTKKEVKMINGRPEKTLEMAEKERFEFHRRATPSRP